MVQRQEGQTETQRISTRVVDMSNYTFIYVLIIYVKRLYQAYLIEEPFLSDINVYKRLLRNYCPVHCSEYNACEVC